MHDPDVCGLPGYNGELPPCPHCAAEEVERRARSDKVEDKKRRESQRVRDKAEREANFNNRRKK